MSVNFFPCDFCGESICDCGPYKHCPGECGRRYCDWECAEGHGITEDRDGEFTLCEYCSGKNVQDRELIEYLLGRLGVTREQAAKDIYAQAKEKQ